MSNRHQPGLYTPGSQTLGKEMVNFDGDIQAQFDSLAAKRRELELTLGSVNGEQEQISGALGELVASGAKYTKQTDRLAALRQESEAIEAGILYTNNQCDLLRRFNGWLPKR